MNHDDERDYAEEAANRAHVQEENEQEAAAEMEGSTMDEAELDRLARIANKEYVRQQQLPSQQSMIDALTLVFNEVELADQGLLAQVREVLAPLEELRKAKP